MPVETDLPFDPIRIRLKIHELRKNLHGLETLLETYGIDTDGPRQALPSDAPPRESQPRRRSMSRPRRRSKGRRAGSRVSQKAQTKPKLADLGVAVIAKHGGKVHGKVIVKELQGDGHLLDVAHPDSNISTALSRDKRVRRVEGERNMWALVGAA